MVTKHKHTFLLHLSRIYNRKKRYRFSKRELMMTSQSWQEVRRSFIKLYYHSPRASRLSGISWHYNAKGKESKSWLGAGNVIYIAFYCISPTETTEWSVWVLYNLWHNHVCIFMETYSFPLGGYEIPCGMYTIKQHNCTCIQLQTNNTTKTKVY